jgi:hypothetical protein
MDGVHPQDDAHRLMVQCFFQKPALEESEAEAIYRRICGQGEAAR